jgi:hypothetical protein
MLLILVGYNGFEAFAMNGYSFKKQNVFAQKKNSSGRVLLIYFLEAVLMFKSSVVLSLVKRVESVLKTDRLAKKESNVFAAKKKKKKEYTMKRTETASQS